MSVPGYGAMIGTTTPIVAVESAINRLFALLGRFGWRCSMRVDEWKRQIVLRFEFHSANGCTYVAGHVFQQNISDYEIATANPDYWQAFPNRVAADVMLSALKEFAGPVPVPTPTPPAKPKTDGDFLREAMQANPKDEANRLVYADWLEENGETEQANQLRGEKS